MCAVTKRSPGLPPPEAWYPLPLHPELAIWLSSRRDLDQCLSGQRSDRDLSAEERGGERDHGLRVEVRAFAPEPRGLLDLHADVEVSRGPAVRRRDPLTGEAQASSVVDPGRDLDLDAAHALGLSAAFARLATLADATTRAAADRTYADGHELTATLSKDLLDLPASVALRARLERGASTGPGPLAVGAGGGVRDAEHGLRTRPDDLQREADGDLHVAPGHHAPSAEDLRVAEQVPEELLEDRRGAEQVLEISLVREVLPREPLRPEVALGRREPRLVVPTAPLGVGEHLVGLAQLLELLFGRLGVVPVHVGMVLAREAAIRLLDLVRARALRYPEDLVEITTRHGSPGPASPSTDRRASRPAYLPLERWAQRRRRERIGAGGVRRSSAQ